MKDPKTTLLAMLSVGMVGTWAYFIYDKATGPKPSPAPAYVDSAVIRKAVRDSLDKIYKESLANLGIRTAAVPDSTQPLRSELENRLSEIYQLRSEINQILKKRDADKNDLDLARKKTIALQMLVSDLQSRNSSIEEEKQQITALLESTSQQLKKLEDDNRELISTNEQLKAKLDAASHFIATSLKLTPVSSGNEKEQEASLASRVSRLIISFAVSTNLLESGTAEVYLVIVQPDGKLLTDDAWESSGVIETRTGDHIRYTRKIRFDFQKGETRELKFSLNADHYDRGTYQLQLYHNGVMIARSYKTLG